MKLLIITTILAVALADVAHLNVAGNEKDAEIVRQDLDVGLEGKYEYAYETSNGIRASESGQQKNIDGENAAESVQGEASWQSPEGEQISFAYIADENGYQPQGSHLPTPHPIPEYILRSLEYIRAHPPPQEVVLKQQV